MLRIRDISLRHRLLVANFTMVFVPIAILTVLGFLLISVSVSLRLTMT